MGKQEFLKIIYSGLNGLPQKDIEKSVEYYSEMIDDYMEDGMSEEEAVSAMGEPNDIINQILMDTSLPKIVKAKVKPSHTLRAWEIILLILGSPIWGSILLALIIVVLSLYIVILSVVISIYAVDLALGISFAAGIISFFILLCTTNTINAAFYLGIGILSFGLAVLLFFASNKVVKVCVLLSKKFFLFIKSLFIRKENI